MVRLLCVGATEMTEQEETTGIIGYFLGRAREVEGGTTYGDNAERYEAAVALQRTPTEPWIFLVDANAGELVIRVSDLHDAAREYSGSSIPRGYLDGRMEQLGWKRIDLDGHALRWAQRTRRTPCSLSTHTGAMLPAVDDDGFGDHVTTRIPTEYARDTRPLSLLEGVERCGHVVTALLRQTATPWATPWVLGNANLPAPTTTTTTLPWERPDEVNDEFEDRDTSAITRAFAPNPTTGIGSPRPRTDAPTANPLGRTETRRLASAQTKQRGSQE